jgi:non-heme chloroperoxidase
LKLREIKAQQVAVYLRGAFARNDGFIKSTKTHTRRYGMPIITTKDGTQIFYKDWGPKDAQPIVFHHGWPLSSDDWDNQLLFFLAQG